jgi:2-hydroxychromene-2-carboxylate isomerase
MRTIEFWLEYASTYSYLSVSRIGRMADERGIAIDWQPFWLHPVRERQGLPAPFPDGSPRERYMWRDLERRARLLGLP